MAKAINWLKIKNDYINSKPKISYRKLASKYKVAESSVKQKAKAENWVKLRNEKQTKIAAKIDQETTVAIVEQEVDRVKRINDAADRLLEKIEEATKQLNNHIVRNKKKTKTIEYSKIRSDKPATEIVEEIEETEFVKGDVDRAGLKMVVSALKELKDITDSSKDVDKDNSVNITLNWKRE